MHWIFVTIAGFLEIGWVISLKYTEGFTKVIPIIFYALFGIGSAFFLSQSMKGIPMATSYAAWMGIAVIGAAVADVTHFGQTMTWAKGICFLLIISGVIGLKWVSPGTH